jgi:RHS repeat-associated protein
LETGADGDPGASQTTRGFTGQEELDFGLVHLNGRIYDPLIARMMSADPMVPDPLNGQAWNRYSYVVNNPLAFTDPSGYCFLGLCGIGNAFNNLFKGIQHLLRDVPIIGTIVEVAAAAICPAVLVCAVAAAFLSTTAVAGIETGNLGLGLKAGLIAAATAVAFWEVGNLTMPNGPAAMTPAQRVENIVGHALVGCGQAVASGGKCGPSALAGAVTSAAGPVINGCGVVSLVANAVVGGGAAVLGGGKFENGAITGAFGYLFNDFMHVAANTNTTPGGFSYGDKIEGQMGPRGWTPADIDDAVQFGDRIDAINKATGGAATRYVNPTTGQSVVIDNTTNEVIQVGGRDFIFGPESGDAPGAKMRAPPAAPPSNRGPSGGDCACNFGGGGGAPFVAPGPLAPGTSVPNIPIIRFPIPAFPL